jgi:hypothetical protein
MHRTIFSVEDRTPSTPLLFGSWKRKRRWHMNRLVRRWACDIPADLLYFSVDQDWDNYRAGKAFPTYRFGYQETDWWAPREGLHRAWSQGKERVSLCCMSSRCMHVIVCVDL